MKEVEKKFVYLVYAPELVHWSAGIKVLHMLKAAISDTNHECYLINHGYLTLNRKVELAKLVSNLNSNYQEKIFVAIYPESIPGNPLGVNNVIRWILNTPGLLGGVKKFTNETVWSYSEKLSLQYREMTGNLSEVLFIPSVSSNEILEYKNARQFATDTPFDLLYAQKFRALGGTPFVLSDNLIEITRFNKNSTSRSETLSLLSKARSIHVFENSTIITEAQVLGVPVVAHRNFGFEFLIAQSELGDQGVSWNIDKLPESASETSIQKLQEAVALYPSRVSILIEDYELSTSIVHNPVKIKFNPYTAGITHKLSRMIAIYRNVGVSSTIRFILNFIKRSLTR